jgi:glucose-6-phosphate 1-dehydrogenase
MKQTAVEWLIDALSHKDEAGKICINIHPDCDITLEIKRAKQMEKEQISMSHLEGAMKMHHKEFNSGDQYYNETYGKK